GPEVWRTRSPTSANRGERGFFSTATIRGRSATRSRARSRCTLNANNGTRSSGAGWVRPSRGIDRPQNTKSSTARRCGFDAARVRPPDSERDTAVRTRAVILAGGEGQRLGVLTDRRAKPAVPFAGKYRIIDFTLSNCVNSGIFDVGVLTQYRPTSLHQHIGIGRPWDLDRTRGGVQLLQPSPGSLAGEWYQGTA